jgi:hypothetical protein
MRARQPPKCDENSVDLLGFSQAEGKMPGVAAQGNAAMQNHGVKLQRGQKSGWRYEHSAFLAVFALANPFLTKISGNQPKSDSVK